MVEIFLLRHGETEWNAQGRYQGQLDSPLTVRGREQARQSGRTLHQTFAGREVPPLHVSPLGRTLETAAIVGRQLERASAPILDKELIEVSTGSWDGLTHEDIDAQWSGALEGSDQFDWYFRSPDGESLDEVVGRVERWFDSLNSPVIAVSHGLLGRVIRGVWLGLPVAEMLSLPVPQDVVWHLSSDGVQGITEA